MVALPPFEGLDVSKFLKSKYTVVLKKRQNKYILFWREASFKRRK